METPPPQPCHFLRHLHPPRHLQCGTLAAIELMVRVAIGSDTITSSKPHVLCPDAISRRIGQRPMRNSFRTIPIDTSISNATRNNISPIRWAYNLYLLSNNSELAPDKKMIRRQSDRSRPGKSFLRSLRIAHGDGGIWRTKKREGAVRSLRGR